MGQAQPYKSKITVYVVACWIFATLGGLMFGYDVGISSGVTSMDDFLKKFFPKVYLAALFASFGAGKLCTVLGRRLTIRLASFLFIAAALISSVAPNLIVLIIGRILFGIGVGFGNESVPLFLLEVALVHLTGGVNILFHFFVTVGILIANLINYFVSSLHPYGWRVALGLAGVPTLIICAASFIITETPTSLIEYQQAGLSTSVLLVQLFKKSSSGKVL